MKKNLATWFCISLFVMLSASAYNQSMDDIDSLKQTLLKNNGDFRELLKLGDTYFYQGEYERAQKAANYALEFSLMKKDEEGQYLAYCDLTAIHLRTMDSLSAMNCVKLMMDLGHKKKMVKYIYNAQFFEGKLNYLLGHFHNADSLSKIAYEAALMQGDSALAAKAMIQRANVFLVQGIYKQAGENYFAAIRIAEQVRDSSMMAVCYTNLGTVNRYLNNCETAVIYHRKALEISLLKKNMMGIADAYSTLGDSYSCADRKDSSIQAYENAIPIQLSLKNYSKAALTCSNLGAAFQTISQIDSALYYHKMAMDIGEGRIDSVSLGNILWTYGDALMFKYNATHQISLLEEAAALFRKSQFIAERYALTSLKVYAYKSLAKVYEMKKMPSEELHYLKLYINANDSLLSGNYTQQLAELQTQFETEKKELEIRQLSAEKLLSDAKIQSQKILSFSLLVIAVLILGLGFMMIRNVQKKRAAEKQIALLEKQNAIENMRSKIAADVHDDMGANLTKLGLNAQRIQSLSHDGEQKQLAEKISHQSREVIIGMREIIWASNPANDNLKSMLGFMRQYIDRFFDGTNIRPVVNFPNDVGEVVLHPEVRRNLFLILKESLNNAMKYSGTDKMDIDFNQDDDQFHMIIRDYGKGLDEEKPDSFAFGLNNMKRRAKEIQAELSFSSLPDSGVQIYVTGKLY